MQGSREELARGMGTRRQGGCTLTPRTWESAGFHSSGQQQSRETHPLRTAVRLLLRPASSKREGQTNAYEFKSSQEVGRRQGSRQRKG
jgi:hypothetical protein